ncbi:hypothetical protein A7982_13750 [Minicystis rosea]|nr:hypothetical protein A7982_13750 [Minicystis rosea]
MIPLAIGALAAGLALRTPAPAPRAASARTITAPARVTPGHVSPARVAPADEAPTVPPLLTPPPPDTDPRTGLAASDHASVSRPPAGASLPPLAMPSNPAVTAPPRVSPHGVLGDRPARDDT